MSDYKKEEEFREFIRTLLYKAELTPKYIDILTNNDNIEEFKRAFTHKSANKLKNYEYYEILGDVTTNKVVVWYYHRRFPDIFQKQELNGMSPVEIMSRLKMSGISKSTYSKFARKLGFEEFIVYIRDELKVTITSLLEDVFEAFIGCLEYLIDSLFLENSGYGVVYIFMSKLMDSEKVSLKWDDLYDPKTKLNQDIHPLRSYIVGEYVFTDHFPKMKQEYESTGKPIDMSKRYEVKLVLRDKSNRVIFMSDSVFSPTVKNAEHIVAKNTREMPEFQEIKEKYDEIKRREKK